MAAVNLKKDLIMTTHQLLKCDGLKSISIRKISQACGCTSAVIYRHFEDLDDLIFLASIKFLENYVFQIQKIVNEDTDPIVMNDAMWEIFVTEAFDNVEVFLLLFFGERKDTLTEKIFEYYQMFPDSWHALGGLFTSIFFHNNLEERITIMMTRAAAVRRINFKDIKPLAHLQCELFHGMLNDYRLTYRQPGKKEEAITLFMETLKSLNEHYTIS
ncbi:MAG: TetR/AcrR family transcriptional regulator [Lachnospiraceae bacterium]|nr:TetR/AcrR family transcriptional regulator [Lachnospiraceae bacterium]